MSGTGRTPRTVRILTGHASRRMARQAAPACARMASPLWLPRQRHSHSQRPRSGATPGRIGSRHARHIGRLIRAHCRAVATRATCSRRAVYSIALCLSRRPPFLFQDSEPDQDSSLSQHDQIDTFLYRTADVRHGKSCSSAAAGTRQVQIRSLLAASLVAIHSRGYLAGGSNKRYNFNEHYMCANTHTVGSLLPRSCCDRHFHLHGKLYARCQ